MVRLMAAAMVLFVLGGCAAQKPQMSRDEYLKTTQRTYPGKTAEDVYGAAEKLFRLADGDDFQIAYTDDSMTALRPWSVYLVLAASMGTDSWLIRTKDEPHGVKVSALASMSAGSILPMGTTGGDFTATGTPSMGNLVQGTALYDTFWARMDYLLGMRSDWMTCQESNDRVSKGITWGANDALCNAFNMKDSLPEALRVATDPVTKPSVVEPYRPTKPSQNNQISPN